MCYTGKCFWEGSNGECDTKVSHCPTDMNTSCECGCVLKQLQDDGKYHCMDCDKVVD